VKTGPRYVTHPEIREQWNIEQAEKAAREKEVAEKEAEKVAQDASRAVRIQEGTASKFFTGSLTSYKRKDDSITLAGALELPVTGIVAELTATAAKNGCDTYRAKSAPWPASNMCFGSFLMNIVESRWASASSLVHDATRQRARQVLLEVAAARVQMVRISSIGRRDRGLGTGCMANII
jgi:hypothetical protein